MASGITRAKAKRVTTQISNILETLCLHRSDTITHCEIREVAASENQSDDGLALVLKTDTITSSVWNCKDYTLNDLTKMASAADWSTVVLDASYIASVASSAAVAARLGSIPRLVTLTIGTWRISVCFEFPQCFGQLTTLCFKGCHHLRKIPRTIKTLSNLSILDLSKCGINHLPDAVGDLTQLTTLNVAHCTRLVALPTTIYKLTSLVTLHLDCCPGIKSLSGICKIQRLRTLTMTQTQDCMLSTGPTLGRLVDWIGRQSDIRSLAMTIFDRYTLPDPVASLSHLTVFDLASWSRLTQLPESLPDDMPRLRMLKLNYCINLTALPVHIGRLKHLTTLDLSGCSMLQALPDSVGDLTSLSELHLSQCDITSLPASVGKLISLTTLWLRSCSRLVRLPKSLEHVPLKTFSFQCDRVAHIPPTIYNRMQPSLETLHIGSYALTAIPDSINQLSRLTSLTINCCGSLTQLPESVGRLPSLTSLSISQCSSLTQLPESVGRLPSLTSLSITRCVRLSHLPESIGQLATLITLDIGNCHALHIIPASIGRLRALQRLYIMCMGLPFLQLPCTLGELCSLQRFALISTSVTRLPRSMGRLVNLRSIEMSHNTKLVFPPAAILATGRAELIISWLSRKPCILVLILVARRRRVWHLPDELWDMVEAIAYSEW